MAKFREYLYILTTFVWDERHLVTHLHLCITVYGHKPPLLFYACLHAPLTSPYECLHEHKFIIILPDVRFGDNVGVNPSSTATNNTTHTLLHVCRISYFKIGLQQYTTELPHTKHIAFSRPVNSANNETNSTYHTLEYASYFFKKLPCRQNPIQKRRNTVRSMTHGTSDIVPMNVTLVRHHKTAGRSKKRRAVCAANPDMS